ncbi:NAD(P)-dependent oxidoreductase [Novosphingobium sp. YJ-S2-02]|uniref:NAD(P)-dependent oxidoreductase n=1 Tax=Novosphingobium aureum TaxID=2792964 RepID=A0A931HBG3_9SPHN|nr:NAD(P)-dependent oxidoreductase [Novosphingobium aureum]MBH0112932.1 NAD(P)-dependent oxidoreductase [Novosphingobium aureum]
MKIAVLGASGHAGSEIVKEAAARGHQVVAIARHPQAIPQGKNITASAGDASDPVQLAGLIAGSDAVISALHHTIPAETLLSALRSAGVGRILVTGGAASLTGPDGKRLIDGPDFPEDWKSAALAGIAFLDALKANDDIDWTFFSPAMIIFEGERLGHYRKGGDELVVDANDESKISFADFALAMVDELETHEHSRARFTAAY